jgi:hypothetical protein
MIDDFERFIVERFLEFYNQHAKSNFQIIGKKDEEVRNGPSYDYHCWDSSSNLEMAIEVKRLLPKETGFEAKIKSLFKKYVKDGLNVQFKGTYAVFLSLDELKESDFRDKNKRKAFFADLKEQIANNKNKNEPIELPTRPKIWLAKIDDEGNDLFLKLINFASADQNEIKRILANSLKKFSKGSEQTQLNVILLLEQGDMCRRDDIVAAINDLSRDCDFSAISEIYNLAIWKETCIARVYPLDRIIESEFFSPEKYKERMAFIRECIEYFSPRTGT